ncbi:MAG: alpha/beta hydrolase [Desulfobacteraceae bacterium]|nr:alpha/beta hydrolase [Desulfobacteraceae bacterium]
MTNQRYSRVKLFGAGVAVFLVIQMFHLICAGEGQGNRSDFRKKVEEAFPEQTSRITERYGLKPYGEENNPRTENAKLSVILVHGLDEPGKVWMNLAPALQENGFEVWLMHYPNDQPIRESAKFLFDQIHSGQSRLKSDLILITHSMGGLVAREMLTSPELHTQDQTEKDGLPEVRQLIMVGTPNHGSHLAHFRVFAELREQIFHMAKGEYHWLLPILDGAGEAGKDLLPGSEFLETLNHRKNPENIKITVIAGVMSPLEKNDARQIIQSLSDKLSPGGKAVFDTVANKVNSLLNELGDGAVSLESARLSGMAMETVTGTHLSIIRNISPDSERIPPAIPVIIQCLQE